MGAPPGLVLPGWVFSNRERECSGSTDENPHPESLVVVVLFTRVVRRTNEIPHPRQQKAGRGTLSCKFNFINKLTGWATGPKALPPLREGALFHDDCGTRRVHLYSTQHYKLQTF